MLAWLVISAGLDLKRLRFGRWQNDTLSPEDGVVDKERRGVSFYLYEKFYGVFLSDCQELIGRFLRLARILRRALVTKAHQFGRPQRQDQVMVDSPNATSSQSAELEEPCLVVAAGTRCTIHPLVSLKVATLGRSGSNDIVVNHEKSSRQHCEFFFEDDAWHVRDLDSRNGTRLNGDKFTGTKTLQHGDMLEVARTRIVFTSKLTAEFESIDLLARDTSAMARAESETEMGLSALDEESSDE